MSVGDVLDRAAVADVLSKAADLLSEPGKWTQGGSARMATGNITYATHPKAVCWCAYGAIAHVVGENPDMAPLSYRASRALDKNQTVDIIEWNDAEDRTADEVVERLRAAATLARSASLDGE